MKFTSGLLAALSSTSITCAFRAPALWPPRAPITQSTPLWSYSSPGADIEATPETGATGADASFPPSTKRGRVNEIDFCIAPADVSLSRSYQASPTASDGPTNSIVSLTKALNNASNRAVRRILLSRSWPSAEALNLSLRQVLATNPKQQEAAAAAVSTSKCPVPRPILNILMRRSRDGTASKNMPRSRTDEEYVADQIRTFRERYGTLAGYPYAEAYLECILSLATTGAESPRVPEVLEAKVYDESYKRVIAVLKSVGAIFLPDVALDRSRIASKLIDQDICLSMIDKLNLKREEKGLEPIMKAVGTAQEAGEDDGSEKEGKASSVAASSGGEKRIRLKFWSKKGSSAGGSDGGETTATSDEVELSKEDLGGVLLSSVEPSITRQLNALANIVQRALLFGGDQELLVLQETLDADKPAFIQRWYPNDTGRIELTDPAEETRPGVQFYNSLVRLLKQCHKEGYVESLLPLLPLIPSYFNAYDRLMATLVELGSGYVRTVANVKTMPIPRTPTEELGRFAVWETNFRNQNNPDASSYPEDLEGTWEVQDEVGGETIGVSTVVFGKDGQVSVDEPLQGLRWRLDPGPTHLDTCTFQVLADDGTILQYRGFIDRGARLEARVSKRSIRIRGSVMFQMRDGDQAMGEDYWKDMLPINYKTGTTKFIMTRVQGKR